MAYTCKKCNGYRVEPGEVVSYSGNFCHCEFPQKPDTNQNQGTGTHKFCPNCGHKIT